jgi:hypothetical protein
MKYNFITAAAILFIAFAIYTTGCNVNQASYEYTAVGGTITDSSTGRPVEGVKIFLEPTSQIAYTDSTGFYYIDSVNCGSSAGNYFINFEKTGYDSMRLFTILYAGDTTKRVNWKLLNSNSQVFKRYGLTLSENIDVNSISNLNAFDLVTCNGGVWTSIDMTLIDSSHVRNSFYLAAGTFAVPIQGLEAYFTDRLFYYMTQQDFDTLSRIDVGNRPLNPDTDFPYFRTLSSYNTATFSNEVYGFHLRGRLYLGYPYNVYGLLRISNFYFDNSSNLYKLVVDVKINRRGQNNFIN